MGLYKANSPYFKQQFERANIKHVLSWPQPCSFGSCTNMPDNMRCRIALGAKGDGGQDFPTMVGRTLHIPYKGSCEASRTV